MVIDGHTRTCGLFGNPVEHTMSPAIHNTIAELQNTNLVYVPFHVPAGRIEDAVKGAFALNLLGCNVTVPYKSDVIPFMKEMDPLAEKIGAVNSMVRLEDGFKGYNTDMPGLYRAMTEDGITVTGAHAIILGAGGVARAVAILLADKGAEDIVILNRTPEKAQAIAEEVNGFYGREIASAMTLDSYGKLQGEDYLCIQATNVGMFPHVDEVVIEDESFYKKIGVAYDLIYNPSETKFMKLTKLAGGKAYNGLKMLLWQGVIAYELWTGTTVSEAQSTAAFEAMKVAMKLPKE